MSAWTTLLQAEALAQALDRDDLVVLDCRFALAAPEAGAQAYLDAHVPGALYAHLEREPFRRACARCRSPSVADAQRLVAQLGAWGISPRHQVVAKTTATVPTPRAYGFSAQLGHAAVAVLDGGWTRWNARRSAGRTRHPHAAAGPLRGPIR